MNRRSLVFLFLFSAAMSAQPREDIAKLKYWSAPLYWQPSIEERARAAKAEAVPLAETPVNSLVFVGMTPCRLVDTRAGSGFPTGFGPPSLAAGVIRSFQIQASTTCTVPSIAQAYSLNVTVIPPKGLGYLTVWPFGAPQPLASTLNDLFGAIIANAAIVPAGNDVSGSLNVFASSTTDLVIDINGYYAAQSGITLAQGTAAAPSLSFAGDAGTGIYSSGAGMLNIATGGATSLTLTPTGSVGIGTPAPVATLEVNGTAQLDGPLTLGGSILATGSFEGLSGNVPVIQAPNDGSLNFSAGLGALPVNQTGTNNTAVGDATLFMNTLGAGNTAVGYTALESNTIGNGNSALGDEALFVNNSGSSNTAIGYGSMVTNTSGSNNTAVGNGALEKDVTGSQNIAIGVDAGFNITASNNIDIGNPGISTDSGTIRVGCPAPSGGCLGVQSSTFIAGIQGVTTGMNNAVPVVIDSNGQLGTVSSSRRYKEDIQNMGDASDGLMQLRPVTFRYTKAFDDGSKPVQYGLIAEEVADVYPDLVARSAEGQVESVRYQLLDPMLLNELQKQNATIAAQKEQIRSLGDRLARIEAMLAAGVSGNGAAR